MSNMKRRDVWLVRIALVIVGYLFLCAVKSAIVPMILLFLGMGLVLGAAGLVIRGLYCIGDWLSYWRSS
jgi:NhaP-type Na+/H+ and K+/H+ antiporter